MVHQLCMIIDCFAFTLWADCTNYSFVIIVSVPPCDTLLVCENGGVGTLDAANQCYCECIAGYTGDLCESKIFCEVQLIPLHEIASVFPSGWKYWVYFCKYYTVLLASTSYVW